jgi:hypothetical protein
MTCHQTLRSLITLCSSIVGVIEEVQNDTPFDKHGETIFLLDVLQSFDFIFMLYLMVEILGITNILNVALQRHDQDLLNALSRVKNSKDELQELRNDGWEKLVSKFFFLKQNSRSYRESNPGRWIQSPEC